MQKHACNNNALGWTPDYVYRFPCAKRSAAFILLLTLLVTANTAGAVESHPETLQRIAFGSCASQVKPQPIWDAVVAAQPQLFLFLGDNIYADTEDMELMRAKYAKLAAKPGYQKMLATCPVLATWDDHDYGLNDGGAWYSKREESKQIMLDFPPQSRRSEQSPTSCTSYEQAPLIDDRTPCLGRTLTFYTSTRNFV